MSITIGVGEEKARVVRSAADHPATVQLLAGKVIGMGILAMAQIAAMVAAFLVLGHAVGSVAVQGAATNVVLARALWLVLGYAFYCTRLRGGGLLITRQADAYNASLPLQLPLILAYVLAYTVLYASGVNWFYHVLAFVPFTAPVAMPVLVAVEAAAGLAKQASSAAISIAATVEHGPAGRDYPTAGPSCGPGTDRVRRVLRTAHFARRMPGRARTPRRGGRTDAAGLEPSQLG